MPRLFLVPIAALIHHTLFSAWVWAPRPGRVAGAPPPPPHFPELLEAPRRLWLSWLLYLALLPPTLPPVPSGPLWALKRILSITFTASGVSKGVLDSLCLTAVSVTQRVTLVFWFLNSCSLVPFLTGVMPPRCDTHSVEDCSVLQFALKL